MAFGRLVWLALGASLGCQPGGAGSGRGAASAAATPGARDAEGEAAASEGMLWLIAAEAALEEDARQRRLAEPQADAADEQAAEEHESAEGASRDSSRESADPPVEALGADALDARRLPDVIYVATPEAVVDEMLELAAIEPRDVLYDLGCGDGRIVIRAAQEYGIEAWGFDIDPARVAKARLNAIQAGVEHLVTIEHRDIFTLDLSPASVVTLYLTPELNQRLIPQLNLMRPGSRVVSHDFEMPGLAPLEHVRVPTGTSAVHDVFLWLTPLPSEAGPDVDTPARAAPDAGAVRSE